MDLRQQKQMFYHFPSNEKWILQKSLFEEKLGVLEDNTPPQSIFLKKNRMCIKAS